MRENKNNSLECSIWEVKLHARTGQNESSRGLSASFIVRLASASDERFSALAAQDRVHGHLVSRPHTYKAVEEEGARTLRELYGIPIDYVLEPAVECQRPSIGVVEASCHAPVELHEMQSIDLKSMPS